MAYSRWSSSVWYTYWDSDSPKDIKEEQIFVVLGVQKFTYRELTDNLDKCAEKCRDSERGKASDKEIKELKEDMRMFIMDVDVKFEK